MEGYYDSDDDVCWGPYTKREFLRDVLQPRNKEDIGSRHSVSDPRFLNDIDRRCESLINLEREPQLQSGYVTQPNKFTEKVTEMLNTSFITCSFESKINDDILNINSGSDNLCLNSITRSDGEALTSTSASSSYKKDHDTLVNYNQTDEIQVISDSEESDASASSSYKKNHDPLVNYNQTDEIQVISDSEESDASFKFNDTSEELEKLLNEEVASVVSSKFSSDAEQELKSNKLNPPTISLVPAPSKSKTNCDVSDCPIPSQSRCGTELKISERLARTKSVSPMQRSKDHFKHIKSPVAVYIKNAPVTPLHVKVTPKKCRKELICENSKSSSEKQNKENVEFPRVIYRPAKRMVANTQSTFKFPNNIESLLPGQNVVIKHIAKIGGKRTSIGRRLLKEDLTLSTISDSSLNSSSQNMSAYETKHAII